MQQQSERDQAVADSVMREFAQMAGDRGVWEQHWQEIAERCLPSYSNTFAPGSSRQPGEKRTEMIVDSTAQVALGRFAAVMDSLNTPRQSRWHDVRASDPYLMKQREVGLWFEELNRILWRYRYAPRANFQSQNLEVWTQCGAFGTGPLFVDGLRGEPGLRYRAVALGEIFLSENHQGVIDKGLRRFPLTARQAVQRWGAKCPEAIQKATNPNQMFYFLHCFKPREEVQAGRKDYRGMAFASYYVSETGRLLMEEGGYRTFPLPVSRYTTAPGEVYGRSPAMTVLPSMKTLNEIKRTMLKQGHRTVDPVLLAHDDGVLDTVSLLPGAVNFGGVNAAGQRLVHALEVGNLAAGKEQAEEERALINDAFLVSLFQILTETPQMTATEVLERVKEKGILLAPTVGRQQSEYLSPLIDREIDVLQQQMLLPPMPPELVEAKGEYRIEYNSPMARAQRAEEASGLMRTVEHALSIVNVTQNPEPLDMFNWDEIIPEVADINGMPLRWMRSPGEIAAIREGRAQQAQQQTMIEAAPAAAGLMKAMQPPAKGK